MAHFAQLDSSNTVISVIVVANEDCGGGGFPDSEPIGKAFIASIGLDGEWKQTSYNNNFRKQYAGIGFSYDPTLDIFIAPQPFSSWKLDENYDWQPPTPQPSKFHIWNEGIGSWQKVTVEGVEQ